MKNINDSYTSASSFPTKLLHKKVISKNKTIKPLHIQLIPTNRCNLHCDFCSCKDRDRRKEIDYDTLYNLIQDFKEVGVRAVTITGGGEPLLYRRINNVINEMEKNNIEVGLVTNGIELDKLKSHNNLRWCRISSSDDRQPVFEVIIKALEVNPKTDWAFSHVVTTKPNYDIIDKLISFVYEYDFTHLRLVPDLYNVDKINMEELEKKLIQFDGEKIIFQKRDDFVIGNEKCLISLLKPVISPEGIFPCCGTQYAIKGSKRDMIKKMKMGNIKDFKKIIEQQKYFDGSICNKCYYSDYNKALDKLLNKPEHLNFV